MPTGKVRFFDADKGFGFIADDDGTDVFLHANALPEGVTSVKKGTRVEFGVVEGRRGPQALTVRVLDPLPSVAAAKRERERKSTEELVVIIEDVVQLLDGVSGGLRKGHFPDRKLGTAVSRALRGLADHLEPTR